MPETVANCMPAGRNERPGDGVQGMRARHVMQSLVQPESKP